ncbi:MAG: metallophosphatase domain-containing protein [Flavisolibacter sp.]
MKIVFISDTHGRHQQIKLPKGDMLIHAGDVTYKGRKDEVQNFLKWFSLQPFQHKIFIAGNHDFYLESLKDEELPLLVPENVIYLKDSGISINGINIWGSPYTPVFYNWAFNRQRGAAIRKHWELIPPATDLLVTHGPAYGFLDLIMNDQHAGCQDLLRTILTIKPKVHVFGHIHESYGNISRSGIQFINASMVDELYRITNPPIVINWKY